MDRGAWQLQSIGLQRVRHNWSDLACMRKCNKFIRCLCYVTVFFLVFVLPSCGTYTEQSSMIQCTWRRGRRWGSPEAFRESRSRGANICCGKFWVDFLGEPRADPLKQVAKAEGFFWTTAFCSMWTGSVQAWLPERSEQSPDTCFQGQKMRKINAAQRTDFKSFRNLFMAVLGLCCCARAFSHCEELGATL